MPPPPGCGIAECLLRLVGLLGVGHFGHLPLGEGLAEHLLRGVGSRLQLLLLSSDMLLAMGLIGGYIFKLCFCTYTTGGLPKTVATSVADQKKLEISGAIVDIRHVVLDGDVPRNLLCYAGVLSLPIQGLVLNWWSISSLMVNLLTSH